jgi:hypothetical protein
MLALNGSSPHGGALGRDHILQVVSSVSTTHRGHEKACRSATGTQAAGGAGRQRDTLRIPGTAVAGACLCSFVLLLRELKYPRNSGR